MQWRARRHLPTGEALQLNATVTVSFTRMAALSARQDSLLCKPFSAALCFNRSGCSLQVFP